MRKTNKQSKGGSRQISYLINIIKNNEQRFRTLDTHRIRGFHMLIRIYLLNYTQEIRFAHVSVLSAIPVLDYR